MLGALASARGRGRAGWLLPVLSNESHYAIEPSATWVSLPVYPFALASMSQNSNEFNHLKQCVYLVRVDPTVGLG